MTPIGPALVVLGLLAVPGLGEASQERGKWWQSERLKSEVGLSQDQSAQIESIFQSMLPRMRVEKDELDKEERALSKLMTEATVDEAGIVQAIERVEAARAAAGRTRMLMLYRIYRVLTAEQRQKLDAVHQRLRGERRDKGLHR